MDKDKITLMKKQIRKEMLLKRETLSELEKDEIVLEILQKLEKHPSFIKAQKVGLYYPIKNEPNLLVLLERFREKTFYFPRVDGKSLSYFLTTELSDLEETQFGLKEPKQNLLKDNELDLLIIPCVATSGLYRIGYGKGYYDRFLATFKGYTIGVTMPFAKFQLGLYESFDVPLDEIL